MISRNAERKCAILVALCMAVAVAFAACGGGGNGSSGGAAGGNTATPGGNPTSKTGTSTPTKSKTQGVQATPTPIPTATGNPTVTVRIGGNIRSAVQNAPPGATVIVPPGKYSAFTLSAKDLQGPITLLADVSGALTDTSPNAVVVDAALGAAAIALSNIPENSAVVIDGFTLRNGTTAGVVVDDSPGTIIQNCTFESNPGDGVRFSGAPGSLLFNNLIINNFGAGVQAIGTDEVEIFNNTFYNNAATGISISDSLNVVVENNIVNENLPFGIVVAADSIYNGDYNLNYNVGNGAPYSPMSIMGANDRMEMPQFIDPTALYPDFHLAAISLAIDAGDPTTPAGLLGLLQQRTTQSDCTPDSPPVDLGYHYPTTDPSCPAPTPTPR
jgi:parallel beta-helix repeat protein